MAAEKALLTPAQVGQFVRQLDDDTKAVELDVYLTENRAIHGDLLMGDEERSGAVR